MHDFGRYIAVPYSDELDQLPDTYAAAISFDVEPLAQWLRGIENRPLVAIGAGGSLAIAQLAASLHQEATGRPARIAEPMDVYLTPRYTDTAVLQITAGGSHGDALAIAERLPVISPSPGIFCGSVGSPLERDLGDRIPIFSFPLLPATHSWVAVNVLVGQAVVLTRAYQQAFPDRLGPLPTDIRSLLVRAGTVRDDVDFWAAALRPVLARPATVCLFGPQTRTFAVDLDSKYAESGLGELSLGEYRNFAHGRYQALLNRQQEYGVLGVFTPAEAAIARAVDESFPDWIPHALIPIDHGGVAANQVAQLVRLLTVVGALGVVRNVEIGWGSRNTFGDPLYDALPEAYSLPS
jgi:hypothetical protein